MGSLGQFVGFVGGGVIGFLIGGPAGALFGASIGAGLGGWLDPPDIGTDKGLGAPDLDALDFTTAEYGIPVKDFLGTTVLSGNVIWYARNRSEAIQASHVSGGKGGAGSSSQTAVSGYKYYLTWAVELAIGPADELYEIYQNELLVWQGQLKLYDCSEDTPGRVDLTIEEVGSVTFYFGTSDQLQDETYLEYAQDENLVPAYRKRVYALFNDCYIGQYNRAPVMRFVMRKTPSLEGLSDDYARVRTYEYNPAHAIYYILTEKRGIPASLINLTLFNSVAATLYELGLGITVTFSDGSSKDHIANILKHIDGVLRLSQASGQLEIYLMSGAMEEADLPWITEENLLDEPQIDRPSWLATYNKLTLSYSRRVRYPGGYPEDPDGGYLLIEYSDGSTVSHVRAFRGFLNDDDYLYAELRNLDYFSSIAWTGYEWLACKRSMWDPYVPAATRYSVYIYDNFTTTLLNDFLLSTTGEPVITQITFTGFDVIAYDSYYKKVIRYDGMSQTQDETVSFPTLDTCYAILWDDGDLVIAGVWSGVFGIRKFTGFSDTLKEEIVPPLSNVKSMTSVDGDLVILAGTTAYRYSGFSTDLLESLSLAPPSSSYGDPVSIVWATGSLEEERAADEGKGLGIKTDTMAFTDPANFEIQGRIKPTQDNYELYTQEDNVRWIGNRALQKITYPYAQVSFPVNRAGYRLEVGDAFRFRYLPKGITKMVLRVARITESEFGDESMQFDCVEAAEYVASPLKDYLICSSGWSEDLCTGGTAVASSEYSGSNLAAKACDDDLVTYWKATVEDQEMYWEYRFPSSKRIERISFASYGPDGNGGIKNFKVQMSDDGRIWYTKYNGFQVNNENIQTHDFANSVKYRRVRIMVIDKWTEVAIPGIWEIEMRECLDAADQQSMCFSPANDGDDGYLQCNIFDNTSDKVIIGNSIEVCT